MRMMKCCYIYFESILTIPLLSSSTLKKQKTKTVILDNPDVVFPEGQVLPPYLPLLLCTSPPCRGLWWVRQLNFLTSPVRSISQSLNHRPHSSHLGTNDHFGNAWIKRDLSWPSPLAPSDHSGHLSLHHLSNALLFQVCHVTPDKPALYLLGRPVVLGEHFWSPVQC